MPRGGLAFYNCGPVSGASQPHKHVQVVPLPLDDPEGSSGGDASDPASGQQGLARPPIWQAVAAAAAVAEVQPGQPFELRNLPYATFAATLPPLQQADAAGLQLEATYQQLLARCTAFVEAQTGRQGATPQDGSLSYNWGALPPGGCAAAAQGRSGCCQLHLQVSVSVGALPGSLPAVCTRDFMLVAPRRQEAEGPVRCAWLHGRAPPALVHGATLTVIVLSLPSAALAIGHPPQLQLRGVCGQHLCAQPRGAAVCAGAGATARADRNRLPVVACREWHCCKHPI